MSDNLKASCVRYEEKDLKFDGELYYPGNGQSPIFGRATTYKKKIQDFCTEKSTECYCKYDDACGGWFHEYPNIYIRTDVEIMKSNWKYNEKEKNWIEMCWALSEMQKTYNHELQHYKNERIFAEYHFNRYMSTKEKKLFFKTEDECKEKGIEQIVKFTYYFNIWAAAEYAHVYPGFSSIPASPEPTPVPPERREIQCEY